MNKKYFLRELITIKNGKDYRQYGNGTVPVYGTGGIISYINEAIYDKESILLPRKGSLKNIVYIDNPFWTVDTMYWSIINKDKVYPKYLFCYLSLLNLSALDSGSTLPSMTFESYYNISINLPEMYIQKKIGDIYFKLKDKIELNNKINNELEAMAKIIYDYWFLQFEFPNEEGKPYKSSGGKMVWNEELKREIPEGWEVKTLENLGNLIMGQSPKSTSYNNKKEGLPLINGAAELQKDKIEITKYTSEPTRICKKEDLIFCIRATIGNINYADKSYCLGRGVGAFRVTEKEYVEYMFLTLRNILNMYNKILTGSIIVGITKEDLLQQNIIKPKNDVITQFYNKVHFMAEKMKSIKKENQELTSLRDFLLPLLMNGQVGFKEDKAEG